ncbi:hypothetical protein MNBD_ALPHA06-1973 [hydrothermal vent metagenome]|uniref:ABC transporter domain-containing protein n=1 Tax=hydrothermal vent metagenome TaxID=652676 RepID=A0A3B0S8L5_9ZZZZ
MLELSGLCLGIKNQPILDDISLAIKPGLTVLVGPNGSGKTTLVRAIAGLIAPDAGELVWQGDDLQQLSGAARAKQVSYLAQNPVVHWPLSVPALVGLARCNRRENRQKTQQAVDKAMSACSVSGFADRRIDQLSGGERARVLLARALCVEAGLLLVDEPTAALDPSYQLMMMQILADAGKAGVCVLCVLHDLPLAARFADQLILLEAGKVQKTGKPADVLRSTELHNAFALKFDGNGHLLV